MPSVLVNPVSAGSPGTVAATNVAAICPPSAPPSVRRNPVSSPVKPVKLACRLCWNVGSAGITAELRTAYAKAASDKTARVTLGLACWPSPRPGSMPSL